MNFIFYDLIFLSLSIIGLSLFLYARRKNLKRQGIMYLYRTQVGIKFIEWTSKKFSKILRPMQYLIIVSGYALMVAMIYLLGNFLYIYLKYPIAQQIKIPPLLPLIPYLPELFKIDFLPPFYFTYWIIIIAVIAVSHEFAHGIFARLNNIKVHSTGFGFLGPFLAAFVEPDEKQMEKSKIFPQLSILAAGTFANVIMTVLFGLVWILFFISAFHPAGVNFNSYGTQVINISDISTVDGVFISSPSQISPLLDSNLTKVEIYGKVFLANSQNLKTSIENNISSIIVFENSPAANAQLKSPIIEIDGEKISSFSELSQIIQSHKPGDVIRIVDLENNQPKEYNIELAEKEGKPYLGIYLLSPSSKGFFGGIYSLISKVRDPFIYYESNLPEGFGSFILDLLWWLVIINISVALVNMLPVGLFDGGKFFYLTILGITNRKKVAEWAFKISTWLILMVVVILMVKWALSFT